MQETPPPTGETDYRVAIEKEIQVRAKSDEQALALVRQAYPGTSPSIVDTNELGTSEEKYIRLKFHPQEWVGDRARTIETDKQTSWLMPYTAALTEDGTLPETNSYESDKLRHTEWAPPWVRTYPGPFYVEIDSIVDRKETTTHCRGEEGDER